MYSLARKLLFKLDPEIAHEFSLDMLAAGDRLKILSLLSQTPASNPVTVMGLEFPNRIGLAAGLDKNADYYQALSNLGFGFVEVGTVTPKPQSGNEQPRLFRLPEHQAIINRMGFNNKGVDYLVERVSNRMLKTPLGINIGKNKITPEDEALSDYTICMEKVYRFADYITVNISSPNTPGLRDLQFGESLEKLLKGIKQKQAELAEHHQKYVPVAVKIAPDMTEEELIDVAQTFLSLNIDCVIATNTTIDKSSVESSKYASEAGGLSGVPVQDKSTRAIKILKSQLGSQIPIIGVGGIHDIESAQEKLDAGASLLQVYTGFIYQGPELIQSLVKATNDYVEVEEKSDKESNIEDANVEEANIEKSNIKEADDSDVVSDKKDDDNNSKINVE